MQITSLGVSVLALLAERQMHPYEMYQLLISRAQDRLVKVRPGSLYHTVDRLVAVDLVRAVGTDRAGNRPERTTYEITEEGRSALTAKVTQMLQSPAVEYPEFPLAVSEAHNLPMDSVLRLLRTRSARLSAEREFYRSGREQVEQSDVARRFWLDITYQETMLEAQIAWVTGLIDELQSGRIDWAPAPDLGTPDHSGPTPEPTS